MGGIDILPVASVRGGSREEAAMTGRGSGMTGATGEFGLRIDFSWKVSRSELGERPPGDGRS